MKVFKSLIISFVFMLLCTSGSFAEGASYANPPKGYVDEEGIVHQFTSSDGTITPIGKNGDSESPTTNLKGAPSPGAWYWAGQDITTDDDGTSTAVTNEVTGPLTFSAGENASVSNPSIINIVVGYNGGPGNPAMTVSSNETSTIGSNVQVNVYAAAISDSNGNLTPAKPYQCFLKIANVAPTDDQVKAGEGDETDTPGPAIIVESGGSLNVYSGGLESYCENADPSATAGLQVTGGNVNVYGGELEGDTNNPDGYNTSSNGIDITGGTVNVAGGLLLSAQQYLVDKNPASGRAGINVDGGKLTLINGTVESSVTATNASQILTSNPNGVWISSGASGSDRIATVFGTNAILASGVESSLDFQTKNSTFTVPTGTSLTLNNNGLNFTNGATMNIQGEVNVNSSIGLNFDNVSGNVTTTGGSTLTLENSTSELNIGANGNVTLGNQSKLNNNGIIDVQQSGTE